MFWLELTTFLEKVFDNFEKATWDVASQSKLFKTLEILLLEIRDYPHPVKFDLKQWQIELSDYMKEQQISKLFPETSNLIHQPIVSSNEIEQEPPLPNLTKLENDLSSHSKTVADCRTIKILLDQEMNEIAKREEITQREEELVVYNRKLWTLIKKFDSSLVNNTQAEILLDKMNDLIQKLQTAFLKTKEADSNSKTNTGVSFENFAPFDEVNTTDWDPIYIEEYSKTLTILNKYKEEFVHTKAFEVSVLLGFSGKEFREQAYRIQIDLYFFIKKHFLFLYSKYALETVPILLNNHHILMPFSLTLSTSLRKQYNRIQNAYLLNDLKACLDEYEKSEKHLSNLEKDAHQWTGVMALLIWVSSLSLNDDNKDYEKLCYSLDKIVSYFEQIATQFLSNTSTEAIRFLWDAMFLKDLLSNIHFNIGNIDQNSKVLNRILLLLERAIKLIKTLSVDYHFLDRYLDIAETELENKQKKLNDINTRAVLVSEYQALVKEYEETWIQCFGEAIEEEYKQSAIKKQNRFAFGVRYEDENSDEETDETESDGEETPIIPLLEIKRRNCITLKQLEENLEAAQKEQDKFNIISSYYDLANHYLAKSIKSARMIKKKGVNFALESMKNMHTYLNIATEKMNKFLTQMSIEEEPIIQLKEFLNDLQEKTNHWVENLTLLLMISRKSRDQAKLFLGTKAWTKPRKEVSIYTQFRKSIEETLEFIANTKTKIEQSPIYLQEKILEPEKSTVTSHKFQQTNHKKEKVVFVETPTNVFFSQAATYDGLKRSRSWENGAASISNPKPTRMDPRSIPIQRIEQSPIHPQEKILEPEKSTATSPKFQQTNHKKEKVVFVETPTNVFFSQAATYDGHKRSRSWENGAASISNPKPTRMDPRSIPIQRIKQSPIHPQETILEPEKSTATPPKFQQTNHKKEKVVFVETPTNVFFSQAATYDGHKRSRSWENGAASIFNPKPTRMNPRSILI